MKFLKSTALVALLFITSAPVIAQKLKPDEIIAKHLNSIGTAEARAAAKSRMIIGDVIVTFITQKNQTAQGRLVMASEGNKTLVGMTLNAADYQQEKFTYDGKKARTAFAYQTQRTPLGSFVESYKALLEEGLLGGVLSTGWAPIDMSDSKAKFSGGGNPKKVDGQEVYVVEFSVKSDLDITLYFEKDTFRHVRTEYKRVSSAGIGNTPEESSRQIETRHKTVESYSDFREEHGLMMPHTYKILYAVSGQRGTTEIEWAFNLTAFTPNPKLDPTTFDQ
jgi:hypothetical protein